MKDNQLLRDQVDNALRANDLNYAYIYNIDSIQKNISEAQTILDSQPAFIDFDVFPDIVTAGFLAANRIIHFLCSNAYQVDALVSLGVSPNRICRILKPSEQNSEILDSSASIAYGDWDGKTVAILTFNYKTIGQVTVSEFHAIVAKSRCPLVIVRIKPSQDANISDLMQLYGYIHNFASVGESSIMVDITSFAFHDSVSLVFRVLYTKINHGHAYAVCSAGTNMLHASGEGLNPRKHKFSILPLVEKESASIEQWTFTGPLCTPSDVMAIKYPIGRPQPNEYFFIPCDRYEIFYSPHRFISHSRPAEFYHMGLELRLVR